MGLLAAATRTKRTGALTRGQTTIQPKKGMLGSIGSQASRPAVMGQPIAGAAAPAQRADEAVSRFAGEGAGGAAKPISVSERAAALASKGSPLMDRARTSAAQYAASRGLLNSSIAAGAAAGAVTDRAAALAQADAADAAARDERAIQREGLAETARQFDLSHEERQRQFDEESATARLAREQQGQQFTEELGQRKHEFSESHALEEDRFAESRRQFQLTFDESRRQFDTAHGENVRQYDTNTKIRQYEFGETMSREDRALMQREAELDETRRQFDSELMQRISEHADNVSLEQARQDLATRELDFREKLDMERFESDVDYRDRALEQERELAEERMLLEEKTLDANITRAELQTKLEAYRMVSANLQVVNQFYGMIADLPLSPEQKRTYEGLFSTRMAAMNESLEALASMELAA